MSLIFLGDSHAVAHLKMGAAFRGNKVTERMSEADVVFVSEDTPTDERGVRSTERIQQLIADAFRSKPWWAQVVLTSQVPPGFTRMFGQQKMFHQAETLRIKDAPQRAVLPDYIMVGGDACPNATYMHYLASFGCPIIFGTWEDAEFSKIAVNMMLAAQVDRTNMLAEAAAKVGANWEKVCEALRADKRIGPEAYLNPGNWRTSNHLLRDWVTLEAIRTQRSSSDE